MPKHVVILAAAAAILMAAPAFAADTESTKVETKVKTDSNGDYERKSSYKHDDEAGTATTEDVKTKVKTDKNGDVTKTVDTEDTTDPKGLMNKTKTKSHTVVKKDQNGTTSYKHKKTVNGKTVEDENTTNQ